MQLTFKKLIQYFGYDFQKLNRRDPLSSDSSLIRLFDREQELLIFDVGAHHGESAKKYAGMFKNAQILSFEPSPIAFEVLKKLRLKRFEPCNFGFSDFSGTVDLNLNKVSPTSSLLPFSPLAKANWGLAGLENDRVCKCAFVTFDQFVSTRGIGTVDFVKIDVQGAEFRVLNGALGSLEKQIVSVVQIELILAETYLGQKTAGWYFSFFEQLGYRLFSINDIVVGDSGQVLQIDAMFVTKDFL